MGIIRKTVSLTGGAVGVPINFRSAKEEVKRELKHQKKRQKEFERQGLVDPEAVLGDMLRADQAAVQLGVADELERLADLRDRGILSDEEFQAQKSKLIDGRWSEPAEPPHLGARTEEESLSVGRRSDHR